MSARDVRDCRERLVERYRLRPYGKGVQFVGLHRGMGLHLTEERGVLSFLFFAPQANVGDEILEHFRGFTHAAAVNLPGDWFRGRVEDDHSCVLEIDSVRLEEIGLDAGLAIPEIVWLDFQAHGAVEPMKCHGCEEQPATEVVSIDNVYQCLCGDCRQQLHEAAPRGQLEAKQVVRWRPVAGWLIVSFLVGAFLWGAFQDWFVTMNAGFPAFLLFLLPFLFGVAVCHLVKRTGTGVTLLLRMAVAATVLAAVLVGNVWGYYAELHQRFPEVPLMTAVEAYFTLQLPLNAEAEAPFLVGGVLGAGMGFWILKRVGRWKVQ